MRTPQTESTSVTTGLDPLPPYMQAWLDKKKTPPPQPDPAPSIPAPLAPRAGTPGAMDPIPEGWGTPERELPSLGPADAHVNYEKRSQWIELKTRDFPPWLETAVCHSDLTEPADGE